MTTIKEIKELYIILNELIKNEDLPQIETLLQTEMNHEIKTATIRFTYPIKHKLKKWETTLQTIKQELNSNDDILIGLI